MLIHSAVITGSVQFNNTDVSGITNVSSFATTASVDALVVRTGSYASTSSVNELQSKTGSYTSTSSFGAYSSSINTFTSSATTRLNTIESVTGSFASTSSVNNLQSVTGSYASTGSNQFNGNQSISGSITSNGTITAQTLVVQTVTSSIEFVTGSTRNGTLSTNTHEFTGSVSITGSAAALLSVNNSILYVSSSRNIGIGTSTPDRPLDIYSSTVLGIARIRGNNSNGVALTIQNDENAQGISIYAAGTSGFGLSGWAGNTALESETGFVYSAYSGSHIFQNGNRAERMRITSGGVVTIGKTDQSGNAVLTVKSPAGGNTGVILIEGDTTNDGWGMYATTADEYRITRFTNGSYSDKVIINSTGVITKPFNPAFRAYLTTNGTWTLAGNDTFIFNATEYNIGSCYNTSNGRFTAPVAGVYQFNFYTILLGAYSNGEIWFQKNGADLTSGTHIHFTTTATGVWHNVHFVTSAYLNSGDYVSFVNKAQTVNYHGDDWSSFSGYLVG
jgi:hypothetical protein